MIDGQLYYGKLLMLNKLCELNSALLTGSSGFIGKYIIKDLKDNFIVSTLSRNAGDYTIHLEERVPNFKEKFEIVVHAAGKAHSLPKSKLEIQNFFRINVDGTNNLLEGLTKSGPPKYFVFISSVSVYGIDVGNNTDENNLLSAVDPYGASKIQAERIVSDWCCLNNVVCTILRLPLIVGSKPPGNLGDMIKGIRKGYYLNIAGGKAKKSMLLAEDVAKAILKVAKIGGVYNLTDGYHPSFVELSNQISIQLGVNKPMNMPLRLAKIIARFGDLLGNKSFFNTSKLNKIVSDLTFDDSKARNAFGWNPTAVLKGFRINE